MFYVEKPDTHPREYELTDKAPEPTGPFRRYITKFEQTPAFIVHSKMHGTHEKPQPYVVHGVSKRGTLLVQATVETKYEPIGRWLEVECGDTQEGYRFKRYLLKPMTALIKLASDVAKANARADKQRAHQADRDEKCGTCPCCFGDYVVTSHHDARNKRVTTKMVHHGYERPGVGYIVGDCHGVGFEPFEVSCEGTKSWLNVLKQTLERTKTMLVGLDSVPSVSVVTGTKYTGYGRRRVALPEYKTIKRGEPGFDREIEILRGKYERQIDSLKRDIATYTKHIADWKVQPFPRVVKRSKAS